MFQQMDKRMLWILFAVMLGSSLLSFTSDDLLFKLLTIPGVLIAITFHEFAHAYAADKLGDDTPRMQGRLNLNPFTHVEPIGFMMLFFAGFGWGRPVEIQPRNFKRDMSMTKAEAIVAAAGPITNFVLAFLFLIIWYLMQTLSVSEAGNGLILYRIVFHIISLNIGLGIFNLIPLPPLDGSKVLMHFLPHNARSWFINNQQIFVIIFIVIWITGISADMIQPIFNAVLNGMDYLVGSIFGLFM